VDASSGSADGVRGSREGFGVAVADGRRVDDDTGGDCSSDASAAATGRARGGS